MKSFFFKGVISIFIVLRGPWPRPRRLSSPRYAPRTNALRHGATYLSLLLSFTIHNNLAQTQQLSNRKYAAFKRAEVPRPHPQRVIIQPRTTQKNTKRTVSSARPSINISKITKTAYDKNKVANKTTKSEKKEK